MKKSPLFFYFLSFLEGASVMAAELLGAKMLAPYFGSSLYVWSAVLAITLGGLAFGYFAGGIMSARQNRERNLYFTLLFGAVFLMLMPVVVKEVILHAQWSLLPSIVITTTIFLFPPVFCMGMVSPMIVACIGEHTEGNNSGKIAGSVYAISTVGGILATFFLGFYCIPVFGLTKPAIVFGIIMGLVPFFKLITGKRFMSLVFPLAAFFSFSGSKFDSSSEAKILYTSEGLLGQIVVADYPLYEKQKKVEGSQRILFVNRNTQTIVTNKNGKKGFFEYVNIINERTDSLQHNPHALVLGLGGGTVATMLASKGYHVHAVELDDRVVEVAKKYFDLPDSIHVWNDDARRFLQGWSFAGGYDVIVLDAFVGEVNPHHLFTQEFFKRIREQLAPKGMFFINGNGYWEGEEGRGSRAIARTLINSGFDLEVVPTEENPDYRNLIFISQKSEGMGRVTGSLLKDLNLSDGIILTDEKPQLELLNIEANKRWREACMKSFLYGYYSNQDRLIFN